MRPLRIVSTPWDVLDANTRWAGGSVSPYVMHQEPVVGLRNHAGAICEVRAVAGAIAPGKDDILVEVSHPLQPEKLSIRSLLDDVGRKARAYPYWGTTEMSLALIRVAAFGDDPSTAARIVPHGVPGIPFVSLLCLTQGIALSESRKFPTGGPSGGRYLPLRLAMGVVAGRWTLDDLPNVLLLSRVNPLVILREQRGREPTIEDVLMATNYGIPSDLSRTQMNAVFK